MSFNIEVEGGKSVRLPTAGKYCEQDIVVTATGGTDMEDAIVSRSISGVYVNDRVTTIGANAFNDSGLEECKFSKVTSILSSAFYRCNHLKKIVCSSADSIVIQGSAFYNCKALEIVDIRGHLQLGGTYHFRYSNITALILRSTTLATSAYDLSTRVFVDTPIANGTGYIYVPSALVDSYKANSNWSVYANQIRAIEDYPEICGTT